MTGSIGEDIREGDAAEKAGDFVTEIKEHIPESASVRPVRELYPDILRTFAAFMVILIHVTSRYFSTSAYYGRPLWWVLVFINEAARIGVPLFFMLSGYLLLSGKDDGILSFYKKRFSKLLLPFLWASVIYYLYYRIAAGQPVFDIAFFDQLFREGTAYHLWYLYSLAMLYLFIPFLKMIVRQCGNDRRGLLTLILLLALLTWQTTLKPLLNVIFSGHLYFYMASDGVVGYFGYALLGYILGHYDFPKAVRRIILALGAVSFVVFPLILGNDIISSGSYIWNGGYTINHYIEAAAVFLFAKELFSARFAAEHPKCAGAASYLSSLTFPVYLIHVLVLEFAQEFMKPLLTGFTPGMVLLTHTVVVTAVSFGLSALWHAVLHPRGLNKDTDQKQMTHTQRQRP